MCEQFAEVVVVWGIFEAEVADVAEVLVELLCELLVYSFNEINARYTYLGIHHKDL